MQKPFNQYAQLIKSFVRYTWFKSLIICKASLIFYHAHPIVIKATLNFSKFVSAWKNSAHFINSFLWYSRFWSLKTQFLSTHQKSAYSIDSFLSTANFSILRPEWPHSFLTTPMPIFFNQLLISMNLHEYAKNQAFSSFCSKNIVNLKILQSDWSRAFWSVSQEPDFPRMGFVEEYTKYHKISL